MKQFGSYGEAIVIIGKMLAREGGWGIANEALQSAIKNIKKAEAVEIAKYEEEMKLAGNPGGFEGTKAEYNNTIQEHEL